jgi:hypothetical protein
VRRLVAAAGLRTQVVASERLTRDGWDVEYFTFRLYR